jgi:hypothetical protein
MVYNTQNYGFLEFVHRPVFEKVFSFAPQMALAVSTKWFHNILQLILACFITTFIVLDKAWSQVFISSYTDIGCPVIRLALSMGPN